MLTMMDKTKNTTIKKNKTMTVIIMRMSNWIMITSFQATMTIKMIKNTRRVVKLSQMLTSLRRNLPA